MSGRRSFKLREIEEALRRAGGIQAAAAELLQRSTGKKCSRQQINQMIGRHPRLQRARQEAEEDINDLAETMLVKNIKAGDNSAIIFRLKTRAKDRGYVERSEVTGAGGGAVQIAPLVVQFGNPEEKDPGEPPSEGE